MEVIGFTICVVGLALWIARVYIRGSRRRQATENKRTHLARQIEMANHARWRCDDWPVKIDGYNKTA